MRVVVSETEKRKGFCLIVPVGRDPITVSSRLRKRERIGDNRHAPGSDAVPRAEMVLHDLRLSDDGDVTGKMVVRLPGVSRDELLPEGAARLGNEVSINDPGI